ncbi:16S rRNA (guanine(966)-N(2))-methyltransferase RsmD [Gordonia sp. HY002]|uniref:16S rRNA (guanine(966)-N(2))-methyltransferase RsmD n=1 Tax=Gordonia zhenghanii TaxID=2911516 RepID=UPI001EEFCBD2|nr:16S rRNA (guanine(966)-N(2))-methyltransferase RsmD [Gordonia zhenghanii]MCF8569505.1 16S rRNA (guanine(966)-N(2))-methyltransferase RsmD [Gordonia zhenghanii]MCF8603914.1 16S rRNA (guanine(966)-N(2))-methyltransferase RsmD [Gordonia zhenghanii]
MTRIIAGEFRGRRLGVPADTTRPTSDRVREAVFSMLGARTDLDGVRVADLYAGTGALGIEAVSRGAESSVLVEADRRAAKVIADNVAVCQAGRRVRVVGRSVESFLASTAGPFDLVFIDPPYDVTSDDVAAVLTMLVPALADDAWVVVERGSRSGPVELPVGLEAVVDKKYGDSVVHLLQRVDSPS